jgi:hypothetical protein
MTQLFRELNMNETTRQQMIDQLCEDYLIDGDFEYMALEEYRLMLECYSDQDLQDTMEDNS